MSLPKGWKPRFDGNGKQLHRCQWTDINPSGSGLHNDWRMGRAKHCECACVSCKRARKAE